MRSRQRQRGIVLVIGLMMLILLTLMAVAALKFGTSNFAVVANQQTRAEAVRAAEQVIDQIIDNKEILVWNGNNLYGTGTGSNTVDVDINGDGNKDYTVVVASPVCVKRQPLPANVLRYELADDLACARDTNQALLGIEGAATGDSLCSTVTWDVVATASDSFQQNHVEVVQGVGQRVATTRVALVCD